MPRYVLVLFCAFAILAGSASVGAAAEPEKATKPNGRAIGLEIVIADVVWKGEGERPKIDTAEGLQRWLGALEKQNAPGQVLRARLSTLDGSPATVQLGQQVGVASGRARAAFAGRGEGGAAFAPVTTSYSMQNVGTLIEAIPNMADDGAIVVTLRLEQSRILPEEKKAGQADPAEFIPAARANFTCQTTIRCAPGVTTVVGGVAEESANQAGQTIVLVTARLLEPAK